MHARKRNQQLLETGLVIVANHLCSAEHNSEFACMYNRDSQDFMNTDKFERFILKKTKATELYQWDLLDEAATKVIYHIVEDGDQGPSQEWGQYAWCRHPTPSDVIKAGNVKTVFLLPAQNI